MADEPAKTPIQDKYAQQYADDLAANRTEQGELTSRISALQERLEQLKTDEHWLAQAQGSLPKAPASGAPEARPAAEEAESSAPVEAAAEAPQSVPQQRQDQSAKEEQPKRPAKKAVSAKRATSKKAVKSTAGPSAKKTTGTKAAAKKPPSQEASAPPTVAAPAPADKGAVEEKSGPPLWQLVRDILLKTPGQPCVAREVHDQLTQDHPGRATSIQTVRNNLETLVKKSLAEKSNQQGSAMYTAYADTGAGAAPGAEAAAAGEAEQAAEAAAQKAPVEV